MVKEIEYKNQKHFYCGVCKLVYKEKVWAEKCEGWCKHNSTCNINISKHSSKKTINDLKQKNEKI